MKASKSLLFALLVGLLSLTFLFLKVGNASAVGALPPLGATVTTTVISAQSIQVTLVPDPASTSTVWSFATSLDNVTRTVVDVVTPTTTLTFNFTALATNTLYYLAVASGDGMTTSSYATSSAVYTWAAVPTTTVGEPTDSTIPITIGTVSNPTSTEYAIAIPTVDSFLDAAGAVSAVAVWQTTSTWGASFAATGLSANTVYQFYTLARNGDNVQTTSTIYTGPTTTLSSVPSSLAVSSASNGLTFSWSAGGSTSTYAEDVTAGTNSGWITGTSFSTNGINCGTTHSFRVKGRNAFGTETAFSSSVDGTTGVCGTGIIVGGGVGATPATPAAPAVPGVSPATPATPATPASGAGSVSLPPTASPVAVFVHTLGMGSKGEEVRALQEKLRELGFFNHPTDTGFFGGVTKAAVVAFQKAQGFSSAPGVVGPATRAALNGEAAEASAPSQTIGQFVSNLAIGSRGEEVRMLQAKLRELGFFNHPTDTGVFGGVTKAAVVAFQKANGLAPFPGHVGPGTRAALNNL